MEDRGNKTIMCSVLFLDIAEYSKKSVSGQISLKDRFNSYLSKAIGDVPQTDRIILDTGDGAAINFLGDVEDALKVALSLRESMLNEDPHMDPPLLVRMGINLGPVRLMRDINGQPNIVGDGINVAQRVMGFADISQILVSRSYYDAVSRLSPTYAGMFHYQGSRTDKHVREHEIYAIGYPGDKTSQLASANQAGHDAGTPNAAARLVERFNQASLGLRALYVLAVAIPVVLVGILVLKPAHKEKAPALPDSALSNGDKAQAASGVQAVSAVAPATAAVPQAANKVGGTSTAKAAAKPETKKSSEVKKAGDQAKQPATPTAHPAVPSAQSAVAPTRQVATPSKPRPAESPRKGAAPTGVDKSAVRIRDAYVSIVCPKGTQLYVDGAFRGKLTERSLKVEVTPGKHAVIVTSPMGLLHKQDVDLSPGETEQVKPDFCR